MRFFKLQRVELLLPGILPYRQYQEDAVDLPGVSRSPFRLHTAPFKRPTNPKARLKGILQSLKGQNV